MTSGTLHQGHRERLRNRFLAEGLDGFEDHQVLELILFQVFQRGDTNPIAHRLLHRFGSLSGVLEADPMDLATVEGVGKRAAAFLTLLPAVTRRYFHDRVTRNRPQLNNPERTAEYFIPLMAGRSEEVFYVLCLDVRSRVLYPALLSEGTVNETHVYPRHVVETAIRHRAASVILAHNHPGGSTHPSKQDVALTRRLVQALGGVDIKVLDHVIVAGEDVYSFAEAGALPRYADLLISRSA
uniref:DNA repair protein RadC n=1 Tax=Candidatus Kentrum sp. MB TaxID=2138164 RepID=A0A450XBC6_9GAMM|nr:MAG: DNA repair protein RadC [Candidatus Kentron sp. MB]VFK26576.1 MAG: DNA repair protein RadC [Candidatus Kentron sp. MB]VFK74538.1 MAG: DNA repair protein RadC [Candidatus Kentron sp. MB]